MFGFDNVFYDKNSQYKFDELNETKELSLVFSALHSNYDDFYKYSFYIFSYSINNIGVKPASIEEKTLNKILIYISEEAGIIPTDEVLCEYFCVFKVHLDKSKYIDKKNLFPYPLGMTKSIPKLPIVQFNDRTINLFFVGNLNDNRFDMYYEFLANKFSLFKLLKFSRIRKRMLIKILYRIGLKSFNRFVKGSVIEFTNGFQKGYEPERYAEMLYNSKIVLSARGFYDAECFRIYEAMRAGCVVISERLPDVNFYNKAPIIQVDSWSGIDKIVKNLLKDQKEMEDLSKKTLLYYNENFSPEGVANYIKKNICNLQRLNHTENNIAREI